MDASADGDSWVRAPCEGDFGGEGECVGHVDDGIALRSVFGESDGGGHGWEEADAESELIGPEVCGEEDLRDGDARGLVGDFFVGGDGAVGFCLWGSLVVELHHSPCEVDEDLVSFGEGDEGGVVCDGVWISGGDDAGAGAPRIEHAPEGDKESAGVCGSGSEHHGYQG